MLDTIKELCSLGGVSGSEQGVRDYILSQISHCAECKVDNLGNLIAFVKGKSRPSHRVMLDAHMDEVGLIITYADDDGCLRFEKVGGIDTRVILGKSVFIGSARVPGVIGVKPIHLIKNDKLLEMPENDSLYIDIGAGSREQALELVRPGDVAFFNSNFCQFGDGFIKARALDDRVGCAILIDMIKSGLEYDMWFSFSVQEEIGLRGAAASAFTIAPEYAIAVETTTAADIPSVSGEKRVCLLGEGPAVSFMDRSTVYDRSLYEKAFKLADINGIKAQTKTLVAGGNNAGAIHKSRGGVRVLTVSVPCRYLHSPACVIKYSDVLDARALICAAAEDFAK